jgi:hypothetical protein
VAAPPNRKLDFNRKHGLFDAVKKISQRQFRTLTIELFMKSFDVPQALVTSLRLSMQPPDLLIRPQLDTYFGVEDIHRLEEAVEEGYRSASEAFESATL